MSQQEQQQEQRTAAPPFWKQFPGLSVTVIIGLCGFGINGMLAGPQVKIRLGIIMLVLSGCNTEQMVCAAMVGMKGQLDALASQYNRLCIMKGVKQERQSKGGIILT